jgi:hypothetical protein
MFAGFKSVRHTFSQKENTSMIRASRLGQMALGLLALVSAAAIPSVHAAVLYENQTGSITTFAYADVTQGNIGGIALSVGSTGYILDAFTFVPVGDATGTFNATVELYALDSNNEPIGSAIASEIQSIVFSEILNATVSDQFKVTPANPSVWRLEANNSYALLVTATGTGNGVAFGDPIGNSPDMTGAGMTFLGSIGSPGDGTWTVTTNYTPWAQITGTAIPVPEPSTYALAAIATSVMAALARRRKASRV